MTRSVVSVFLVAMMILGASVVSGQEYPIKTIRIIPGEAGGGTDLAARLIAQGISGPLGQPVTVENRPSVIAIETVAKAPPDGYTLLLQGNVIWAQPLLRKVSYDPERDLSPITWATASPLVLVVHPSLPIKSVKQLIALAKARPGELNYSSGATGVPAHLAAELFKAMANVNIVRINYKGGAPAFNALITGEVQLTFGNAVPVAPYIKSGRLKGLAVTSAQPSALFPEIPTVAAAGLPGYESVTILGIFAPGGTPAAIINRLNQEIVRVLSMAEVKKRFLNEGLETVGSSPEQLAAAVKADTARIAKVIKDNRIRID